MLPTKEQIEAIIRELQKILNIQQWEITFYFCDKYKMKDMSSDESNWAACKRNMQRNCAQIYLNTECDGLSDWYDSIVHEMYHIVTQDWNYHSKALLDYVPEGAAYDKEENMLNIYYESSIDRLAQGFVNAYPVSNFNSILNPAGNSDIIKSGE